MSNRDLSKLVSRAEAMYQDAETQEDLKTIIQLFCDYKGALVYDFKLHIFFLVIGLLMVSSCPVAMYLSNYHTDLLPYLITSFAGLAVAIPAGALMYISANRLPELSENILFSSAFIHDELSKSEESNHSVYKRLRNEFPDYERGNASNEILYTYLGNYKGERHKFDFSLHRYKYVIRREEPVVTSDGKKTTITMKTVYYDYHRWAIVVDFPWVNGVYAQTDGQASYRHSFNSPHPMFKQNFRVNGISEMACAKFLKPVTVLLLCEMLKEFCELNLEFSTEGHLHMSFTDSAILCTRPSGLELTQPHALLSAVENGVEFANLKSALARIHQLAEQHDNNFEEPQHLSA